MDNVNHLNELSIQSQLSTLEKLVADAEQSTDARRDFEAQPRAVFQKYGLQTSKSKREIEKSLYELVESTEKEARVPVARAAYRRIQLLPSKALGRWEFRIPGKGKARPIRTAPAPSSHFTPRRKPSGPSRSRWSRHPRTRPGRPPIRRHSPARRPRTSRRR